MPQAVQEDAAQAAFENGVLTLMLPKSEARLVRGTGLPTCGEPCLWRRLSSIRE